MSELPPPGEGRLSNLLPVPYVTPYTDRTPTLGPMLVTAISGWAFLMVEWGSLRWIDHAPPAIWIGSTAIGVCVLTVIANKDWLNFKNRRYFPVSLAILIAIWAAIVGLAYYLDFTSSHDIDPVVTSLKAQLATALRERDVAILERDTARNESGKGNALPPPPSTPPIEKLKADDVEARIDAWKGIESQMNDFTRVLDEGDQIVNNWKTNQPSLQNWVNNFRNHLSVSRERLSSLVGTYPDFSDLRIVDQNVPTRLWSAIQNLFQASAQLSNTPTPVTAAEYVSSVSPFMGPFGRQLATVRQWGKDTKNLANSSISELEARKASK